MAEKSSTPSADALKKLEEQLICAICLDHYTDPKTLICLHSFCHQCLVGLPLDTQGKKLFLSCPACRIPTQLPEAGVAGFPKAFFINNLTEVHSLLKKVSSDRPTLCDNCNKSDATGYCKQCTKFFCADCLSFHNKWVTFTDHTVISLDEVAHTAFQLPSITREVTINCSSHDKPLEIYCETCHNLICHNCTVRIHKGHEYDLVSDTYDHHRQIIESSLKPVREQIVVVKEAVATLTQREKDITHQGEKVKKDIEVMFKQIIDFLQSDVDLAVRHKLSMLSQQKRKAETTLGQLTDCFDFVEQGLKVGTPQQVLLAQPQMIDRMNSVIKSFKPESFQPLEQADIKLVKSKIEDAHKSFGEVNYSSSIGSCKVRNINQQLALMGKESTSTIVFEFPDGSPVPVPSSRISCYLTPPYNRQPIECKVKGSTQSGQYIVVFTPTTHGLHHLHVKVHDINVPGSPFKVHVSILPKMRGRPVKIITGLLEPWGIDVTDDGLMIVSEFCGHCITVLDREAKKIKSFKMSRKGQFYHPSGIAVTPNRTILVGDSYSHRIQELTMEGQCVACVGNTGDGPLQFQYPKGIVINKATRQIYVADNDNHRIQVLNPDLTHRNTFGSKGSKQGQFNHPEDVTLDSKGFVYVTDYNNHRIQKFTPKGIFAAAFGSKGSLPGQLSHPIGITVDDNDLLYVTESTNYRISIFTTNGKFIHCFGEKGNKDGQLNEPRQLAIDAQGYLYVCDYKNSRLVVY